MASEWFAFVNEKGDVEAVNLDEAGALTRKDDGVCVQWGGMDSECTFIPKITVEDLLRMLPK